MGVSRPLAKPNFEQRRQIILLRHQGVGVTEIARRLGIGHHAIGSYFRRLGWDAPDSPQHIGKQEKSSKQSRQSRLTVATILRWADRYYEVTGVWPRWNSGAIPNVPGETWQQIDRALFLGTRGLPSGLTLLRLLRDNGRIIQRRDAWRSEEDALLGSLSDEDAAAQLGRTEVAVSARRRQLGIPKFLGQ